MNIAANIKPTQAEAALIERLKATDTDAARAALDLVSQTGLPTRRVESWHYTDLRNLLKDVPEAAAPGDMRGNYEKLVDTNRLLFVDGQLSAEDDPVYDGVMIETIEGGSVPSKVDDAVAAFCALATEATKITIEGNATVTGKPLGLAQVSTGNGLAATHMDVTIKAGADAEVIDRHFSTNGLSPLNANVVDLTLEAGAKCHWFIVQQESEDATRLARMNINLAEDSDLTLFIVNAGGKLVRQEVLVQVNGENANITMKGVNLVGEGSHVDVTTLLAHNVPNTTAEEIFRNVITGNGKGVFQGQIKVAQPAQKTDAQMACNTLLLTDEADFSAKPELEIFADDVICAHGATVTDIEDDHLFYLKARGIDDKTARNMLVKAFVDEIVEDLDDEPLEDALTGIIDDWLDTHA